ncbi:32455_t:CDS:1 [Racocetra persica]|uniref:32455_t:CDS:1 n=1 Tax=Racocetra persica TaxID=160502 RepID=A0ACA9P1M2_9GLOM|nr:32455_t:CDS:1 [Racocetra persica]
MPKLASLKTSKQRKINGIRIYRCLKGFTILFTGKIEAIIEFKNILKKSDKQTEADLATVKLQHFSKTMNYYTTFELNQVTYNKLDMILIAKYGSGETIKSSASKKNEKATEVTKYEIKNLTIYNIRTTLPFKYLI